MSSKRKFYLITRISIWQRPHITFPTATTMVVLLCLQEASTLIMKVIMDTTVKILLEDSFIVYFICFVEKNVPLIYDGTSQIATLSKKPTNKLISGHPSFLYT